MSDPLTDQEKSDLSEAIGSAGFNFGSITLVDALQTLGADNELARGFIAQHNSNKTLDSQIRVLVKQRVELSDWLAKQIVND